MSNQSNIRDVKEAKLAEKGIAKNHQFEKVWTCHSTGNNRAARLSMQQNIHRKQTLYLINRELSLLVTVRCSRENNNSNHSNKGQICHYTGKNSKAGLSFQPKEYIKKTLYKINGPFRNWSSSGTEEKSKKYPIQNRLDFLIYWEQQRTQPKYIAKHSPKKNAVKNHSTTNYVKSIDH